MPTNSYEQRRLQNIADNKRVLAELGLLNPFHRIQPKERSGGKRDGGDGAYRPPKKVKRSRSPATSSFFHLQPRRSCRLLGLAPDDVIPLPLEEDEKEGAKQSLSRPSVPRNNFYGAVPGVEVGQTWEFRMGCSVDGVHRPTVAGIHGGPEGAYSIAMSGGYEDDQDLGDKFTYTGEGGRDLKGTRSSPKNLRTAPQSRNQQLTRGNLALSRSVTTRNPVRVIRGYKLRSPYAPESGYRYDGLYTVDRCWATTGLAGFLVYKFALVRCPNQAPLPFALQPESGEDTDHADQTSLSVAVETMETADQEFSHNFTSCSEDSSNLSSDDSTQDDDNAEAVGDDESRLNKSEEAVRRMLGEIITKVYPSKPQEDYLGLKDSIRRDEVNSQGSSELGLPESVGDAEESVGDAEESVGDVEESVGDAEESVGDAEESVGDVEERMGDAEESEGNLKESEGNSKESVGDAEEREGNSEESVGESVESAGNSKESVGDAEESRAVSESAGEDAVAAADA